MKTNKWILASLVFAGLIGCAKKADEGGPRLSRAGGTTVNTNVHDAANCSGNTCGVFYSNSPQAFEDAWLDFFGATEDDLGSISSNENDDTGARFYGRINTTTAFDCRGSGSNVAVDTAGSSLTLMVFDSYAVDGEEDVIKFTMQASRNSNATINGNRFSIDFEDAEGVVYFDGTFDAQYATGTLNFENFTDSGSVEGPQNVILFRIPTRALFNCR